MILEATKWWPQYRCFPNMRGENLEEYDKYITTQCWAKDLLEILS